MARMPGTVWQGEHGGSLMTRHDVVCVHTIVGYAPAHAAHFSVKGDGTILQSRDTRYKSAANLNGNHRVIAIENEDHGSHFPKWGGSDVPALTPAQVAANARILRWAHDTHGVPLQLCPNSRPTSRGLAYHRQGCDGNFTSYPGRVSGGEVWSKAFGKVCPGDRRIAQLPAILSAATGGVPIDPVEEDDMPYTETQLVNIVREAFARELEQANTRGKVALHQILSEHDLPPKPAALVQSDAGGLWWLLSSDRVTRRLVVGYAHAAWLVNSQGVASNGKDAHGRPVPYVVANDDLVKVAVVGPTEAHPDWETI